MSADLDEMEALLTERQATAIGRHLCGSNAPYAPIATMAEVTLGKMVQPERKNTEEIEAPYLRAANISAPGQLDLTVKPKVMWFSQSELSHLTLDRGDVVIVEGGAGYGRAALVGDALDGWAFQNSIVRVRPRSGIASGPYLAYALQHAQAQGHIEILVNTATLPHFTAEKVERFRLPLPPLEEQRRIADQINRETVEIDAMLADIAELRDLLAERRAAAISAAVAGQIHVPTPSKGAH
ncbi:restriction endonuclease subunit S [Corynebacterium timonense]|nr:restriction endonuclease subunit S [Corynebacterium timonense]